MGFLAPWFLGGLAAIGLPVWLHLLRKHRSTPRPFSSLMFFERHMQSSIKHRRLEHLLLFSLRAALVGLLALAFANPFVHTANPAAENDALVVLAVDQSFSMRYGDRLERARREALAAAGRLGSGRRAEVLAFAGQARFLTQPTRDASELRAALQSIEPTDSRGSYGELVRVLRLAAASARAPLEVHLFSDMQKSALPPGFPDLRLPPGTRLVLHSVAGAAPNWAVESVHAPGRVFSARKARVQAVIAGFGTAAARRRVSLLLNGRAIESRDAEVPANGRATIEFASLEAPYGWSRGEVRVEDTDGLPEDNHAYFSIERAEPRPALFVEGAGSRRAALYFRTALEAAPESPFQLEQSGAAAPSLAKYAFVVLSDPGTLPPAFEDSLRNYVRGGGSVWIALGPATAAARRVPVTGAAVRGTSYASREGERFTTVADADPDHPSIRGAGGWQGVKFFQAVRVDAGNARVLARLSDGTPALLEQKLGEGRVLVFASTFDNVSNDFPLHAPFVPFVQQTALYLGGLEERAPAAPVDSYVELRTAADRGAAVAVLDPQGRQALSLAEAATATSLRLARQGFYEVRRGGGRQELVAVNADRRESDLEPIPSDTLALWQKTGEGGATSAAGTAVAGSGRRALWWFVVLAAALVAVAESLVGNRLLAERQREERVELQAVEKGAA